MGDLGSIPRLGRSPGGGHSNPFQYSCLENPHGQRSLAVCKVLDSTERLSTAQHKVIERLKWCLHSYKRRFVNLNESLNWWSFRHGISVSTLEQSWKLESAVSSPGCLSSLRFLVLQGFILYLHIMRLLKVFSWHWWWNPAGSLGLAFY